MVILIEKEGLMEWLTFRMVNGFPPTQQVLTILKVHCIGPIYTYSVNSVIMLQPQPHDEGLGGEEGGLGSFTADHNYDIIKHS